MKTHFGACSVYLQQQALVPCLPPWKLNSYRYKLLCSCCRARWKNIKTTPLRQVDLEETTRMSSRFWDTIFRRQVLPNHFLQTMFQFYQTVFSFWWYFTQHLTRQCISRISCELTCPTKLDATAVEYYNSTAIKLQILQVWQGSRKIPGGNTCYQSQWRVVRGSKHLMYSFSWVNTLWKQGITNIRY